MALTIEQKIAQKEAELARLKDKNRKLANAQKIIVGSVTINEALKNKDVRQLLLNLLNNHLTRSVDKQRMITLIHHLNSLG